MSEDKCLGSNLKYCMPDHHNVVVWCDVCGYHESRAEKKLSNRWYVAEEQRMAFCIAHPTMYPDGVRLYVMGMSGATERIDWVYRIEAIGHGTVDPEVLCGCEGFRTMKEAQHAAEATTYRDYGVKKDEKAWIDICESRKQELMDKQVEISVLKYRNEKLEHDAKEAEEAVKVLNEQCKELEVLLNTEKSTNKRLAARVEKLETSAQLGRCLLED